jgi:16S rRNA processing protein RimM
LYIIGYILKPQGILGEVKVNPVSQDPKRRKHLKSVYLHKDKNIESYSVQRVRVSDKYAFIKFAGIDSRDKADLLRNAEILIDAKDLIRPSSDEFFIHDLLNCRVVTQDGTEIGWIKDVVQMPGNDVYVVTNEIGDEFLIPAIKQVIQQVDISSKKITIQLLDGLLD